MHSPTSGLSSQIKVMMAVPILISTQVQQSELVLVQITVGAARQLFSLCLEEMTVWFDNKEARC